MKIQWSLIAGLVFALLTALFAVVNVDPVPVNFGFDVVNIPLILVILGCALIGGIIVGSYGIFRQYKLQKQIKALTAENTKYRETYPSMDNLNSDKNENTGISSTQN